MNRLAQKTMLLAGAAGTVGAAIADAIAREGGIAIRTDARPKSPNRASTCRAMHPVS